jgi:hypothetical protein
LGVISGRVHTYFKVDIFPFSGIARLVSLHDVSVNE